MADVGNWIGEVTTTSGSGAITLGGALTGYAPFSSIPDGLVWYSIKDGNDRECGIGTLSGSGAILTRTTVQATLVGGVYDDTSPAAISLSGLSQVYSTFSKDAYDELISNSTGSVGSHSDVTIGAAVANAAATLRVLADANTDGTYTVVDWTPPSAGGGEANTTSNDGAGEGLAKAKSGVDLPFKSLVGGANVTLSSDADTVTINATGGGGTVDVVSNVATSTILGRITAGNGDSEELTPAATRALLNVEDGATADQTGAEIKAAYEAEANTNAFTDAEQTKLAGIEALADVTDSTNVNAAGAVMESDYTPARSLLVQQSGTGSPSIVTLGLDEILGRQTGGGTDIEGLSATQVRAIINIEDGADVTDETNVKAALDGATITAVTPASTDRVLMLDASDANNLKVALYSDFSGGGGGGGSFDLANRNDDTTETLTESTATRVSITTATITKTLPAISGVTDGAAIAVSLDAVTEGTGSVTISRGSTDTIDWKGVALTSVVLYESGDSVVFYADADNSQWRLIYDGINGPHAIVERATSNQTITDNTETKIQFNSKTEDYHGAFDSTTNYRCQPDIPGKYNFNGSVRLNSGTPNIDCRYTFALYKNGSFVKYGPVNHVYYSDPEYRCFDFTVYLNGGSDYVEIYVLCLGDATNNHTLHTTNSHFEITRVN